VARLFSWDAVAQAHEAAFADLKAWRNRQAASTAQVETSLQGGR
jgi:hypothetical protein